MTVIKATPEQREKLLASLQQFRDRRFPTPTPKVLTYEEKVEKAIRHSYKNKRFTQH